MKGCRGSSPNLQLFLESCLMLSSGTEALRAPCEAAQRQTGIPRRGPWHPVRTPAAQPFSSHGAQNAHGWSRREATPACTRARPKGDLRGYTRGRRKSWLQPHRDLWHPLWWESVVWEGADGAWVSRPNKTVLCLESYGGLRVNNPEDLADQRTLVFY